MNKFFDYIRWLVPDVPYLSAFSGKGVQRSEKKAWGQNFFFSVNFSGLTNLVIRHAPKYSKIDDNSYADSAHDVMVTSLIWKKKSNIC